MHLEMLTNRLEIFVKAEKYNVFFYSCYMYVSRMSPACDLTCLPT